MAAGSNVAGQLALAAPLLIACFGHRSGTGHILSPAMLFCTEHENEWRISALPHPPVLCRIAGAASLVPGAAEHHAKPSRQVTWLAWMQQSLRAHRPQAPK